MFVCLSLSGYLAVCLHGIFRALEFGEGEFWELFPDVRNPEAGARHFQDTSFIFFFFYECPPLSCFPIVFFARPAK